MSLLKQVLENQFTMNPDDWGVGALPKTANKVAVGDPSGNRPFTTFLLQRNAAEEEEKAANEYDPDDVVNDTLRQMSSMGGRSAYMLLFKMVKASAITPMQFVKVLEYYGKK